MIETDAHLSEAYVLGVLTEALAAYIQPVLADEAPLIGAHTAAKDMQKLRTSQIAEMMRPLTPRFRTRRGKTHHISPSHRHYAAQVDEEAPRREGSLTTYGRPCCD